LVPESKGRNMKDEAKHFQDDAERAFAGVLSAQQNFALAAMAMEEARATRDQAILDAAAIGFPRRTLAQATRLTPGRVQQIVDAARELPNIQPALRMERERRQRSQQLAELARRHAAG
jgi:hypothetical protein